MKRLTEAIRFRVSETELEHLQKCSSSFAKSRFANGKENFSAYIREKVLQESGYRNVVLEQKMTDISYELRKIGTNINQIAKKINAGFGNSNDLVELQHNLKLINEQFEEFKEEVDKDWQSQS